MEEHRGDNITKFFSGGGAARDVITMGLEEASVVRIATAFFEPSGYQCLRNALRGKEIRLLVGRPENQGDKIEEIVREFIDTIMSGPLEERKEAMEEMRDALRRGVFLVSVSAGEGETVLGPRYLYQHGKIYIADDVSAVVTSANMTFHGLVVSREAGITLFDREDVDFFIRRFDEYYERAVPVAEELLAMLEEWLAVYRPYDIYIRSLLELYGLPSEERPGRLPELAGYQRPVVSRVLRNIDDFGGAMLVASTGLGKTIMAAHVVAYLSMRGNIHSAIVLCPAGLRTMWKRTMRAARVSSEEFSYHTLSVDDWRKDRNLDRLERELEDADSGTIIIIDESHHLRNPRDEGGNVRLRYDRVLKAVQKGVRVLLMTATPYSKGVGDINAQLSLLPWKHEENRLLGITEGVPWKVHLPEDLSGMGSCVVLSAPSVVRHFSSSDPSGERYVLFSGDKKRFFPGHIHIKTSLYDNICDDMLIDLMESGLLRRKVIEDNNLRLFQEDEMNGSRSPFMEAHIVHQFCSSVKLVDELFKKMEVEEGFTSYRFANQKELTGAAGAMRRELSPFLEKFDEPKALILVDILKKHSDRKAVIFCHYHDTARYVVEALKTLLPDRKVETTIQKDPANLERIIRDFAPVANSIDIYDDPEEYEGESEAIDILVATGSMAEGFNLQDASLLVNFDLPWTVLVLAQRMGRILRPWHEPREIYIYNLIPSTMGNDRIHLALNWKERLRSRNLEFRSFAEIPVIVERDEKFEMTDLARTMQHFGDADLDLDEVIQFIENAGELKTTSFIDDLAVLDEKTMTKIRRLPPGIRSCKQCLLEGEHLYLLMSYRQRLYPVVFDRDENIYLDSQRSDEIMSLIRSAPEEGPHHVLPAGLEKRAELCRNSWGARRGIEADEIKIICMMVLAP